MRSLARLSLAMLGLALAMPATAWAQTPATVAYGTTARKHTGGLFRRCMCTECQRARIKAKDGVDVPAPPPVPPNLVSVGGQECVACQEGTIVNGEMPGYAVVGEPSPVGNATNMAMAGRRGKKDPSVAAAQYASPNVMGGPGHNRPHVLTHLFGLDAIGKREADAMERRQREKHASIAYGPKDAPVVTDLPVSVVNRVNR